MFPHGARAISQASGFRMNFRAQCLLTAAAALGFSPQAQAAPAISKRFSTVRVEQTKIFPKTDLGNMAMVSDEKPVLLEAETIDYQQANGLIIATGHVAVTQEDTVLLADHLAYDREGDLLLAKGNVSILDPSGNVFFADEMELTGDMKAGTLKAFKARFNDNSLLAANSAKKLDEHRITLDRAMYSPCNCADEETGDPLTPQWAIQARRARVDQEDQMIRYDDVFFNLYDVPIFYSPYFSHATPRADNKSGLLLPEYLHTENVGSMLKVPVYYAIAPDRDLTITPIYTSAEGMVMAGEYRQKFDSGQMIFDGSATRPSDRDAAGNITAGNQFRGHIDGSGQFDINPDYRWGFDVHRASDDTYLRRYKFSGTTLLTSRAYIEGFNLPGGNDRSYGSLTGLYFQGLTQQDDRTRMPMVLPLGFFTYESDPLDYDSRFMITGNVMSLTRDIGSKSHRASSTAGWRLPYITDDGQVIEFRTQLRGDLYSVEDVALSNGRNFGGTTGRLVPQASLLWRYPFINRWDESSLMLEPVVMLALSPGGGNPEKIPNEDSIAPEFTDTNLFDANRFAGYDRIESGPRINYGVRGQIQAFGDKYLDWLIGQNYRVNDSPNSLFSSDPANQFSDYVGKVGITASPLTFAYRFRLSQEDWSPKRNEFDVGYSQPAFNAGVSYLQLKNDPVLATKESVTAIANIRLARQWTWGMGINKDLELDQITSTSMGLTFKNECTAVSAIIGRDYTRDRDLKPSTSLLFRISLKNLE